MPPRGIKKFPQNNKKLCKHRKFPSGTYDVDYYEGLLKVNTAGRIKAVVKFMNMSSFVEKNVVSVSMMIETLTESKDKLP